MQTIYRLYGVRDQGPGELSELIGIYISLEAANKDKKNYKRVYFSFYIRPDTVKG